MSTIRDEIRAILREELAAIRAGFAPEAETVRIASDADLNRFALDILERAQDPGFAAGLRAGDIRFALAGVPASAPPPRPIVASPPPAPGTFIDKKLVTEGDIAGLATRHLRLPHHSRLTPLAQDEARRKGIRIERVEP